jgi:hypothetical protein
MTDFIVPVTPVGVTPDLQPAIQTIFDAIGPAGVNQLATFLVSVNAAGGKPALLDARYILDNIAEGAAAELGEVRLRAPADLAISVINLLVTAIDTTPAV